MNSHYKIRFQNGVEWDVLKLSEDSLSNIQTTDQALVNLKKMDNTIQNIDQNMNKLKSLIGKFY